ncbi:AT-rich interactive domain-containing protein 3C [Heterocephalus glaber]|uniref:AT-rich interactive domain-containing protein 3 n=1 Tax=Heterocephalus glaber TaxID=10181 RepID=G5B062_HETGA|nr:AT-rich interactive domain-containing protein 3C [Heterocephalus glaber]
MEALQRQQAARLAQGVGPLAPPHPPLPPRPPLPGPRTLKAPEGALGEVGAEEEEDAEEDEEEEEAGTEEEVAEESCPGARGPSSPTTQPPGPHPHEWTYEEQFKQLYELDADPKRKEFLDDLFSFMQKRGTPVNRVPIMAKQVLDLYALFRLVTAKGGLVEVINRKVWREVTRGLSLPTTITSAAFTLRTHSAAGLPVHACAQLSPSPIKKEESGIPTHRLALPVGLTLGPVRKKMAPEEPPEKRAVLMGPMDPSRPGAPPSFLSRAKIPLREEQLDEPLNLAGSGISSINMALEINGVVYTGILFARRQPVTASQGPTNPAPPPSTGPPANPLP